MVTLHTNTNLVVVDVVVTDEHQNPVHNLTQADFTLSEDGSAQKVKIFEEHTANAAAPQAPPLKLNPDIFTNYTPTPANGALNILVLDSLNTPLKDHPYLREQLLKYLKEAPAGTRIAIFGLSSHLFLIQGFTTDPDTLRAALNSKKAGGKGSPLFDNAMTGDAVGGDNPALEMATEAASGSQQSSASQAAAFLANLQQFLAEQQSFMTQLRVRYTLDAFNQLGRYLSNLPGRKNLIWFSGSFPINIMPDGDLQNPFAVAANYENEFRQTVNLMARSQVAVYPVDVRGVMTLPMYDAGNSGRRYASNPTAFGKDQTKFFQNTGAEHSTMTQMAEATGGKAFFDTNALKEAVQKAVEAGSNYYTLAYSPSNPNWKGEYRKIHVTLARQGVNLAYRRGYFADDPNAPVHHGEPKISATDHEPYEAMRAAMMRGGPEPAEVVFLSKIRPASSSTENELATGNKINAKVTGPYRRYSISYALRPSDIDCPANAAGVRHCELEFLAYVYDADGNLLVSQASGIVVDIPPARLADVQKSGLQYHQTVSVPVKGEHFFRIGVHDRMSDHVGALEVPVARINRLPTLDAPPPAASPAAH
jgi:VWFA-related protein